MSADQLSLTTKFELYAARIFSSPQHLDLLMPICPLSNGYSLLGLFPRVKQQGHEADHSPPTSAEVKKTWIYTFTPTYTIMAWCLISSAQEQLFLYFWG
jgi:hypothetical protein